MRYYSLLLLFYLSCLGLAYSQGQKSPQESLIQKVDVSLNQILSPEAIGKINKFKTVKEHKRVTVVKLGKVKELLRSETLLLQIPGAGEILGKTKRYDHFSPTESTWFGEFKNGSAIIIEKDGRVFGEIREGKAVFEIKHLENDFGVLIEHDMYKVNALDCATDETGKQNTNEQSKNPDGNQAGKAARAITTPLVRVLVLFTQAALNTGNNMNDVALLALSQFASAGVNSNVNVTMELAGVQFLDFVETTVIKNDVTSLRNNITAQQLRNQFQADIVMLLANANYGAIIGIVQNIGPINADAYGISLVGSATSSLTFIHEAAHMFGCRHQSSSDTTPGDAHGYGWTTGIWPFQSKFGTIMHTNDGRTREVYYSNPNVNYNGHLTGVVGDSFNARVLNVNSYTVQDFRVSPDAFATNILGSRSANGGVNLTYSADLYNGQAPYTYSWQANKGTGYYNAGTFSALNITMPSDHNLEIKLTVTDANGQLASDYVFVQNLYLDGGCTQCPDTKPNDVMVLSDTMLQQEQGITLYPNPSGDKITFEVTTDVNKPTLVQIFDGNSLNVFQLEIPSTEKQEIVTRTIDIQSLQKGIYFIRYSNSSKSKTYRFVKQ